MAILSGAMLVAGFASSHAGAATRRSIPATMIGAWGWSAQSCANPDDDGRLTITARSAVFAASSYEFQEIVVRPDGSIRATARTHEEGEAGTSGGVIELSILGGRLSVTTVDAGNHMYLRCAAGR